jgi:hypothetical protein
MSKRRAPVETLLEPVEEIGQHWRDDAVMPHQRLGLETLHVGDREIVIGGVEQPPVGPFERVGRKRGAQRRRLEQQRQPGQRALFDRRAREIIERRPDRFLDLRGTSIFSCARSAPIHSAAQARSSARSIVRSGWNAAAAPPSSAVAQSSPSRPPSPRERCAPPIARTAARAEKPLSKM